MWIELSSWGARGFYPRPSPTRCARATHALHPSASRQSARPSARRVRARSRAQSSHPRRWGENGGGNRTRTGDNGFAIRRLSRLAMPPSEREILTQAGRGSSDQGRRQHPGAGSGPALHSPPGPPGDGPRGDGEIGRRIGLKIRRPRGRGGSSPPLPTGDGRARSAADRLTVAIRQRGTAMATRAGALCSTSYGRWPAVLRRRPWRSRSPGDGPCRPARVRDERSGVRPGSAGSVPLLAPGPGSPVSGPAQVLRWRRSGPPGGRPPRERSP